jgi:hypothetical protein
MNWLFEIVFLLWVLLVIVWIFVDLVWQECVFHNGTNRGWYFGRIVHDIFFI